MTSRWKAGSVVGGLAVALALMACGEENGGGSSHALPQGGEPVHLEPAEFTTKIDNPYWPMKPGAEWVYREADTEGGEQKVVVTVTNRTKRIANGITARVVRDIATEKGVPTEVTDDWYAQDKDGNIWYLGERSTAYENGKPKTTAGSFEAGIHGAQPGIAMPADAKPGMSYRQEYLKGEAEDTGAIVTVGREQVEVPFGFFHKDVLMTRDLEPTEPKVQELKFYARGVGPVLSMHTDGPGERAALVRYTPGR
jgi:hypothetical protein